MTYVSDTVNPCPAPPRSPASPQPLFFVHTSFFVEVFTWYTDRYAVATGQVPRTRTRSRRTGTSAGSSTVYYRTSYNSYATRGADALQRQRFSISGDRGRAESRHYRAWLLVLQCMEQLKSNCVRLAVTGRAVVRLWS